MSQADGADVAAVTEPSQKKQAVAQEGEQGMKNFEFLLDIPLNISVEVGRTRIMIKDLLQMREGSVVELDKLAGDPLDVYVNSRLIAKGEAVLVNDKFGIRLTDVVSPSERIEKLG
ncbi:MAG: flagellar motor switch protein FliN [Desulfobacterales bacterium]|nr:flagellar motor switch protein FliN [Desulfobacterales bacterium]